MYEPIATSINENCLNAAAVLIFLGYALTYIKTRMRRHTGTDRIKRHSKWM